MKAHLDPRLPLILRLAAPLLFLAALLAACSREEETPRPCPPVTRPQEARNLTRFDGAGRDLTDVLFEAELANVQGTCSYSRDGRLLEMELEVTLVAGRGPANRDQQARFGYFVAVVKEGVEPRIVAREEFLVELRFDGNRSRVGRIEEILPKIPLTAGETGANYRLYVGLLLTPEDLKYNQGQI